MLLERGKGAKALYSQIAEILRDDIESGKYHKGDLIPTEKELEKLYSVSRVTVRQAIGELVNENYLNTAQGIGTTVIFDKINENLKGVKSFSEEMAQHGMVMKTSYCTIEKVGMDRLIAKQFGMAEGTQVNKLVRVRDVSDRPLVYSITYINNIYDLPLNPYRYHESLYYVLKTEYDIRIVSGSETFEAVVSDKEISKMLEVSEKTPIFKRVRKTYDQHNNVLEYTVCYYIGSRYKYSITI